MAKKNLQQALNLVSPRQFTSYQAFLQALYHQLKTTQPRYSYAELAKDLGFAPTNLVYQIIRGKRPLAPRTLAKMQQAMRLKADDREYFELMMELERSRSSAQKSTILERMRQLKSRLEPDPIADDWAEYYALPHHAAIRELMRTADFRSDPQWIADQLRLPVRPEQVKQSLKLLLRLGLVRFDADAQRYEIAVAHRSTGPVADLAVTQFHAAMIDAAQRALIDAPAGERDISAVTLCVNDDQFGHIQDLLHELQMALVQIDQTDAGPRNRVIQVNLQAFALSKKTS